MASEFINQSEPLVIVVNNVVQEVDDVVGGYDNLWYSYLVLKSLSVNYLYFLPSLKLLNSTTLCL